MLSERKVKSIIDKITSSEQSSTDVDGKVQIGDRTAAVDADTFLFDIQKSRANLSRKDPDYKPILNRLDISPQFVANTESKQIVKPKRRRTVLKPKNTKPVSKKSNHKMSSNLATILKKKKKELRNAG